MYIVVAQQGDLVVQKNGYDGIKVNGAYGIYNLVKIATSEY